MSPNKNDRRYFLIIPAAGQGKRMLQELPKQYQLLAAKPVLQHTLERLASMHDFHTIVLAVADQDLRAGELVSALSDNITDKLLVVTGGDERAHSVLNALLALTDVADDQDWILVHDAVRPCVQRSDVSKLINELADEEAGGLLALTVRDTVKCATSQSYVSHTQDRNSLWLAATPQMFRYGILCQALQTGLARQEMNKAESGEDRNPVITDEASAVEALGLPVKLIAGQHNNIKITFPEDFVLAEVLLLASTTE